MDAAARLQPDRRDMFLQYGLLARPRWKRQRCANGLDQPGRMTREGGH